jgi:hypothetical protein
MKKTLGVMAAMAIVLSAAFPALAADQVSGGGQTSRSASFGFVIHSDLTGELQYISNSGRFHVHCVRFSSFESSETGRGFPRVTVTARKCFRPNGTQRFLRVAFVDRGEPGIGWDIVRMRWSRTWPVTNANTVRRDSGRIEAGDVQIL